MGNIALSEGIEQGSHAFQASVLTSTRSRPAYLTTFPIHADLILWLLASEVNTDYYYFRPGIVSRLILMIRYIQAVTVHIYMHIYKYIHMVGSVNIHVASSAS